MEKIKKKIESQINFTTLKLQIPGLKNTTYKYCIRINFIFFILK